MKKLLTIIPLLIVVFIAGRLSHQLTVNAQVKPLPDLGRPDRDVNGDGERDVSDAVFLLRHLFSEGPPAS